MSMSDTAQQMSEMDELESCFDSFDDIKQQLEEVESALASRLKIRRHVRRELLLRDRANKLGENELIARWHELYSSYAWWLKSEAWAEPPPVDDCESDEGAANAALAAFVGAGDAGFFQFGFTSRWPWTLNSTGFGSDSFRG